MTEKFKLLSGKSIALWAMIVAMSWGIGLLTIVVTARDAAGTGGDVATVIFMSIIGAFSGLIGGIFMGFCQRLLLYHLMNRIFLDRWIVSTHVGMILGWFVAGIISLPVAQQFTLYSNSKVEAWAAGMLTITLVVGLVLGVLQWLALQRQTKHAYWWIVASAVGWAVGGAIYAVIYKSLGGVFFFPSSPSQPGPWPGWATLIGSAIVGSIFGGMIIGLVTGVVLRLLLAQPSIGSPRSVDTAHLD